MLIVCPTCATTYQIAPAALGEGRNVRCAQCKNAWFATPEPEFEEAVAAPAAAGAAAKRLCTGTGAGRAPTGAPHP